MLRALLPTLITNYFLRIENIARSYNSAGPYVTKKGNGSIYLPKAILLFKSTHQGLI